MLKPSVDPVRTYVAHVRDVFPGRDAAWKLKNTKKAARPASRQHGNLAVKTHFASAFADA
jgi:hypothetical protein